MSSDSSSAPDPVTPTTFTPLLDFPRFTPVANIAAAEFANAIAGHLPYSSFNRVSLRCFWPDAQVARLGDGVALILTDPFDQTPFLTLLSRKHDSPEGSGSTLRSLLDYARQQGLGTVLRLVPECSLANLPPDFQLSERPDGFDHIVAVDSMLNPTYSEGRRKHRLANDYVAANPGVVVHDTSLNSSQTLHALKDIDRAWQANRDDNGTLIWEHRAFLRCLALRHEFSLTLLMAFGADGAPLGFFLGEILGNGFALWLFGKTLPDQHGLNQLLLLEAARVVQSRGCRWINFQEDHGVAGLRQMRRSWKPERQLRVYDVSLAGA